MHASSPVLLTYASPLQEAARPKMLKRDEWMLVPPSSSDLLSSAPLFPSSPRPPPSPPTVNFLIYFLLCNDVMVLNYSFVLYTALDPTKLNKPRQFSRSTSTPKTVDNTLWTETPAEKQQRLADEVMGKRRRAENADPDQEGDEEEEGAKRRKREAELQRQVEEHTVRSGIILVFIYY